MSIKDKIKNDLVTAMKSQDKEKVAALRLIQAALRKKEIDSQVEMDDSGMSALLQNMAKQRRDSIDQFRKGGREDLVAKETKELEIIESYMPAQLSEEEIVGIIQATIQEIGATSMKDMGAVMKSVGAKTSGRADGGKVSQLVKAKLSS